MNDSLNNYREVPPKVKISNEESLHYLWRIIHCLELKSKKKSFFPYAWDMIFWARESVSHSVTSDSLQPHGL